MKDSDVTDQRPGERSPRQRVLGILRLLWVLAIIIGAVWYLTVHWEDVASYAADVGPVAAIAALLVLTVGRVLLSQISRIALGLFGTDLSLGRSFYINTIAQLGKYIPGAIWHLVGRVALYRKEGVTAPRASAALAVENGVLLGAGLCLGVGATAGDLLHLAGWSRPSPAVAALLASGAAAVWWVAISQVGSRLVRRYGGGVRLPSTRLFIVSVTFWATFGLAFWLLLPPSSRQLSTLALAAGTFAIAWVVGYISPFAPAGIGVREAVIVALLGPAIGVPAAAATAAGSRIVWTVQELATAPMAALGLARGDKATRDAGVVAAQGAGSPTPPIGDDDPPPEGAGS